ncbi:MAG: polymerase subunit sigma-24 [Mycobacterium sp.]|nr:polymerase subunit sigma-24 [Mycobacterium sp.]
MSAALRTEDLLRELAPQVLGALVRRHGDFARCEDAVQEALVAAHAAWTDQLPDNPRGWLSTVATRRLIDGLRADAARERREEEVAQEARLFAPAADEPEATDDTLALLVLCCHPALTASAQLALTLRAVGGLTTAEIARALLLPEATMGVRISRAKASIRSAGARFVLPPTQELALRLDVVRQILYLMFNEGWSASSGEDLLRPDLTAEALRLTRLLHERLPSSNETTGLLALMLLQDSRRETRIDEAGWLVPLAEQDRSRWDAAAIAEGTALVSQALSTGPAGAYQVQAAIAALHAEATSTAETDWPQIVGLYEALERIAPNPMVSLNRAVAVGMASGPQAGLALVDELAGGPLGGHHRVAAVRAHLLERAGEHAEAARAYREAAANATNQAEQRFLTLRASAADRASQL